MRHQQPGESKPQLMGLPTAEEHHHHLLLLPVAAPPLGGTWIYNIACKSLQITNVTLDRTQVAVRDIPLLLLLLAEESSASPPTTTLYVLDPKRTSKAICEAFAYRIP